MAIIRWTPTNRNRSLRNTELDALFEDFWRGFNQPRYRLARTRPAFSPRVNLIDREQELLLEADVPGLEKEDLDITINDDIVTLKGERKTEKVEEDESTGECYHCRETTYGAFERSFRLPEKVQSDKASAALKNGVLTLTLPKAEVAGAVKIEVN